MTRFFIPFIVLLMALMAMPSRAQEMTKAEMAGIRAAYSAAKAQVERNSHAQEQNVPRSDMEIVSHYVIPRFRRRKHSTAKKTQARLSLLL